MMKLGICNETFQDWPFEKAFKCAKELGYTGIEIAPFTIEKNVNDISSDQRTEVRQLASEIGLEVIGLHWLLAFTDGYYLTSPDEETQKRTTDYLCSLSKLCNDLGGGVMVLGSPQQRNLLPNVSLDQAMEIAAKVISDACDQFAADNVVLALEPLGPAEGDFLLTAEEGVKLMRMINHPNVQLHLDVKAMSSEEKSIPEIIKDSADHIAHFHANDPNKRGPGMGDQDFAPIIAALKEINYDKWISVEVFDYDPGIEALATESINCLRSLV